jgi:peptidoglycan/xylan/chitin deacetylase (PgdA/CDA1 family)
MVLAVAPISMRDLIGYGRNGPDITWPNGARLAISLVINFEEGAELQVADGDNVTERIGEVLSVVGPGTPDMGQAQIFSYGMRAGLWRFLDALDARTLPVTFFCCGRAIERVPALVAEITRRGHEPACHGWRWRPHADYRSREEEGVDLDRCIRVTLDAAGERPYGFFCRGSESIWTRALLAERGFLYTHPVGRGCLAVVGERGGRSERWRGLRLVAHIGFSPKFAHDSPARRSSRPWAIPIVVPTVVNDRSVSYRSSMATGISRRFSSTG